VTASSAARWLTRRACRHCPLRVTGSRSARLSGSRARRKASGNWRSISAPIGVTCNLIASWIYDALKWVRPKQADALAHQVTVKLVIRADDKATEIALELGEVAAMAREIEEVVARVDQQR
jgi:hypothetical protein